MSENTGGIDNTVAKESFFRKIVDKVRPSEKTIFENTLKDHEKKLQESTPSSDLDKGIFTHRTDNLHENLNKLKSEKKISLDEVKIARSRLFKLDFPTTEQETLFRGWSNELKSDGFIEDEGRKSMILDKLKTIKDKLTYKQRVQINKLVKDADVNYSNKRAIGRENYQKDISEQKNELSNKFKDDPTTQEEINTLRDDQFGSFSGLYNELLYLKDRILTSRTGSSVQGYIDKVISTSEPNKSGITDVKDFENRINQVELPPGLKSVLRGKLKATQYTD